MLISAIFLSYFFFVREIESKGDYFRPKPKTSGPWVKPTEGEIWPRPYNQHYLDNILLIDAKTFSFKPNQNAAICEKVMQSLPRFWSRMFPGQVYQNNLQIQDRRTDDHGNHVLTSVLINLDNPNGCEIWPHPSMNESYRLVISSNGIGSHVSAGSVWGLLRGLESLSQLVYLSDERGHVIRSTEITDGPRFPHRGFMVDSSRHFLSMKSLMQTLDLMEMNKMNVFHWHLTDDPSFPYQSHRYPQLSDKGAFDPVTHVYTQADVKKIIDEAALRGIRVIPEFDTPGHTLSWGNGIPQLLTKCYQNGQPDGRFGPMNPIDEEVYDILDNFFQEVKETFPDVYVHIGGDEVNTQCWSSNPEIVAKLKAANFTGGFIGLEGYFIRRIQDIISSPIKKESMVWQEAFDNRHALAPLTIVQVWKNWGLGWRRELEQITKKGHLAILSAPWYLNYLDYGADWIKMYSEDPHDFKGTNYSKQLVLGGEACIWGEFVNTINLIPRSWPRASAVAEKLWSAAHHTRDARSAGPRLQEHECRMLARGFPVQPVVGAGYCAVIWDAS